MLSCMLGMPATVAPVEWHVDEPAAQQAPAPPTRSAASADAAAAADAEYQRWLETVAERAAKGALARPRAARYLEERCDGGGGGDAVPSRALMAVQRVRSAFWAIEGLEEFDARPTTSRPRKVSSSPTLSSKSGAWRSSASRPSTRGSALAAAGPAPAAAAAAAQQQPSHSGAGLEAEEEEEEEPMGVDALADHCQGGDLNDLVWPAADLSLDQQLMLMRVSLMGVEREVPTDKGLMKESSKDSGPTGVPGC